LLAGRWAAIRTAEPAGLSNARPGTAATAWAPVEQVACDRCGFSHQDGNVISLARFRVTTPKGALHFCGHHWRKFRWHIIERGYQTTEL